MKKTKQSRDDISFRSAGHCQLVAPKSGSHSNKTIRAQYAHRRLAQDTFKYSISLSIREAFDRTDLLLFIDSPLNYRAFCLKQRESTFLANTHSKWKINASGSTGLMPSSFEKDLLTCRSRAAQINFSALEWKTPLVPLLGVYAILIQT